MVYHLQLDNINYGIQRNSYFIEIKDNNINIDIIEIVKKAQCPICHVELSYNPKENVKSCKICRREYWPVEQVQETKTLLEQYDLETVSNSESGGAKGPF